MVLLLTMSQFVRSAAVVLLVLVQRAPDSSAVPGELDRIFGGTDCKIEDHAYLVSLVRHSTQTHYCGGALVKWDWVLTAGHCLVPSDPPGDPRDYIMAGTSTTLDLVREYQSPQTRRMKKVYVHSLYSREGSTGDDIGMVQLDSGFVEGPLVALVKLPPRPTGLIHPDAEPVCRMALVAGWGGTKKHEGSAPEKETEPPTRSNKNENWSFATKTLQCLEQPFVKNSKCMNAKERWFLVKVLCTMSAPDGKGICVGDSGSPVVCADKPDTVVGVVSARLTQCENCCGEPNRPQVFTRVDQYLNFIESRFNINSSGRSRPPVKAVLMRLLLGTGKSKCYSSIIVALGDVVLLCLLINYYF